jgi:hypothetical protein
MEITRIGNFEYQEVARPKYTVENFPQGWVTVP